MESGRGDDTVSWIEDDAVKQGKDLNNSLARMTDKLREDLDKARGRGKDEERGGFRGRKGH